MFTRISHLQAIAFNVFHPFVRIIGANTWITGIQRLPEPENQLGRKPVSGDQRQVALFQTKTTIFTITFEFHEDWGWYPIVLDFWTKPDMFGEPWSRRFEVRETTDSKLAEGREYVFRPDGEYHRMGWDQLINLSPEAYRDYISRFMS